MKPRVLVLVCLGAAMFAAREADATSCLFNSVTAVDFTGTPYNPFAGTNVDAVGGFTFTCSLFFRARHRHHQFVDRQLELVQRAHLAQRRQYVELSTVYRPWPHSGVGRQERRHHQLLVALERAARSHLHLRPHSQRAKRQVRLLQRQHRDNDALLTPSPSLETCG